MKEETLSTESTKRELKYSSSAQFQLNDDYYSLAYEKPSKALSLKAKKIIEKYKKKKYSNIEEDNNLNLIGASGEEQFEYKQYFYEEGDSYEKLINKNKNLKRLFEQANCSLILCLKKQEKIEKKYENEKRLILEQLNKIQDNYEIYAKSYQKLNEYRQQIKEKENSYNQLLSLYDKDKEKLKEFKIQIFEMHNNIDNFIKNNYKKDSTNLLSLEYLLHLKAEIYEKFKIKEMSSTIAKNEIQSTNEKKFENNKFKYFQKKFNNKNLNNKI